MSEGHWRNLTARKMPWRPKAGELQYPDRAERVGPDPLGEPPRLQKWNVPGPLGAVVRLGSMEFQALGMDGPNVLCVCASDGHVTRMDKVTYEIAAGLRKPPAPQPCLITVLIDGEQVPLDRCDWVLFGPCGCPEGLHVAASGERVWAADEETAWACMFERKRERDKARREGCRLELMTCARCSSEVLPLMRVPCTSLSLPAR